MCVCVCVCVYLSGNNFICYINNKRVLNNGDRKLFIKIRIAKKQSQSTVYGIDANKVCIYSM